jgi:speckle-type POZ protein
MASERSESANLMRTRRSIFQFEIDYTKAKNLPFGTFISSPTFTAGGYDWHLEYFPHGGSHENKGSHSSLFICLQSEVEKIRVEYCSQVLDKKGDFITVGNPEVLNFTNTSNSWGEMDFIASNTTEELYCVNGVLVICCSIRVLTDPKVVWTYPGGLCEHIEKLWEEKERFDVTFDVEGESISAHRFMLAARSPVFKTELFGPMEQAKIEHIKINEMKADVFRALLNFVYTDQLAKNGSSDHETLSIELLQDLLVAADQYRLDKLTLLCEEKLEKNLSVDTVVTTLILADRHNRTELKNKCLDFACRPKNFSLVALTEGYFNIMTVAPSLLTELSEKVKCMSHSGKKRRTG